MPAFHYFLDEPIDTPLLKLRGLGYREAMRRQLVDRPQGTGDVLIMYFYEPVWVQDFQPEQPLPAGRVVVWDTGAGHFYGSRLRTWRHSWIHCDGDAIHDTLRQSGLPLGEAMGLSDPTIIEEAVLALHTELYSPHRPDTAILVNTLDTLLRRIARDVMPERGPATPPPGVLAARRYLERFHDQPLTLDDLADHAGYSASHLTALFREHFGLPPIAMLIRHRMTRAVELLADRNRTVTDIAHAVGYDDPFHFSKLFKKHHGRSPSNFRSLEYADNLYGYADII